MSPTAALTSQASNWHQPLGDSKKPISFCKFSFYIWVWSWM